MTSGTIHIIGAGLAGLTAALDLAAKGHKVALHESSNHAGGRCRSYIDQELGLKIDNGNHLILSGNRAVSDFLRLTGSGKTLIELPSHFRFVDLRDSHGWTVKISEGRLPLWIFNPLGRVPGSHFWHYLRDLKKLRTAAKDKTATTIFLRHCLPLCEPLWEPLAVSILNTELEAGSAQLLWQTFTQSLAAGGSACHPLLPSEGLSESLVAPALAALGQTGHADIRFNARLRHIAFADQKAIQLDFGQEQIALAPDDRVILAVPPAVALDLVPGLVAPDEFRPIVNAHFAYDLPSRHHQFIGTIGGMTEWVFIKPGIVSITISAAEHAVNLDTQELLPLLWREVCTALDLDQENHPSPPSGRIVKEKRATFAATPAQNAKRPDAKTAWSNLYLAGDWIQTGLPATIEGAVRSGFSAAALARDNIA